MSWRTKASPSGRAQGVEHHQERHADRVGEERLVLGVAAARRVDDRVGEVDLESLLSVRGARAQQVERDAGDDRGQPAAEVLDLAHVGSADPDPGVLHGVVRLAERAEHPVGNRPQPGAMLPEALGQPIQIGHVTFLRPQGSSPQTRTMPGL
jgi:hypothetical protein